MKAQTEQTIDTALGHGAEQLDGYQAAAGLEARVLLAHVLGQPGSFLYSRPRQTLTHGQWRQYADLIERRRLGEPVAYITGVREFWSLSLNVTRDTLIPRAETELLVDEALQRLPDNARRRVADLGTGSGAIALALAHERPRAAICAFDVSAQALAVARGNAARLGIGNIEWVRNNWLHDYHGQPFDLIAANPPYIRSGDPHLQRGDLRHEPRLALESGTNGLEAIEIIIEQSKQHLCAGGWLLIEHGYDQQQQLIQLLHRSGYRDIAGYADLAKLPRVVAARRA